MKVRYKLDDDLLIDSTSGHGHHHPRVMGLISEVQATVVPFTWTADDFIGFRQTTTRPRFESASKDDARLEQIRNIARKLSHSARLDLARELLA
jgi:hypothetical protein